MKKNILCVIGFILVFLNSMAAFAAVSPTGYWKTISDVTHKPRSIMQLYVNNGVLYGKVVKVFKEPGDKPICEKCPGDFKNQKVLGLQILWGLQQTSSQVWDNGKILEPKTGKIYSAKITVSPDGKQLTVRGYQGMSMLGRSQTWVKVNTPS